VECPRISRKWRELWYLNALITLPIATLCAALSWHMVENPILRSRRSLIGMLDRAADQVRLGVRTTAMPMLSLIARRRQI
jgi:peptidoglycan/LPS O-acetylase OafA/YrhL